MVPWHRYLQRHDAFTCMSHSPHTNFALFQASVDWLFDGFNATLLAFGQSGMGKSATLFAEGSHVEQPLFHSILQQMFAQKLPAAHGGQSHRIGFSCWELLHHQVFDLLADPCQQDGPNQVGHTSFCALFFRPDFALHLSKLPCC